jgi:hydrogenase nickel incorporation protein HypB
MCGTCGCQNTIGHSQVAGPSSSIKRVTIDLEAKILAKNDALAERNRTWFASKGILALNLVSSPGSGKTTLLCRTIVDLAAKQSMYVIEGDQETSRDADRIRATGAAAVQLNTGTGCHLEADMIARGVAELRPANGGVVMIENVGNLVCPALFDLGERAKVAILSVTEGDDKPLKYPHMFRASTLMLLNKIDLLAHVDFDVDAAIANAKQVNPEITVLCVSARTGEGLPAWYAWIEQQRAQGANANNVAPPPT